MFYPPGLDFVIAFFAVLYAGAIAVPLVPARRSGASRIIAALMIMPSRQWSSRRRTLRRGSAVS
jgi:acyl-CoA synthetase (AMP-forming)/AMP-acid ligase II